MKRRNGKRDKFPHEVKKRDMIKTNNKFRDRLNTHMTSSSKRVITLLNECWEGYLEEIEPSFKFRNRTERLEIQDEFWEDLLKHINYRIILQQSDFLLLNTKTDNFFSERIE